MTDGEPQTAADDDPFALLGLEPSFALADEELRRALMRAGSRWHPDRFALAAAEERQAAEERMAAINGAFATLADPLARAGVLLRAAGVDVEAAAADPGFLMEVLELREAAADCGAGMEALAAATAAAAERLAAGFAAWEEAGRPATDAATLAVQLTEAKYLARVHADAGRALAASGSPEPDQPR